MATASVCGCCAIVVWVGGLIFFAFVEAPTAFHVMGTSRQFALLIDGSITVEYDWPPAGLVFLLASMLWFQDRSALAAGFCWRRASLIVLMIAATMVRAVQHHPRDGARPDCRGRGHRRVAPPPTPFASTSTACTESPRKSRARPCFSASAVVLLMAAEPAGQRPSQQLES
jgi:hypothetical protein